MSLKQIGDALSWFNIAAAGVNVALAIKWWPERLGCRHRWRLTGYEYGGAHGKWWQQACRCGAKRIATSTYRYLRWDDADEAELRTGKWRFDQRLLDAGDLADVLSAAEREG